MHNSQYIDKQTMQQVRICLAHRQARGEKIKMGGLLTEIVQLGLEEYVKVYGIMLEFHTAEGKDTRQLELIEEGKGVK